MILAILWAIALLAEAKPSRKLDVIGYYINLNADVERREHMEEQVKSVHLPVKRFSAVSRDAISAGVYDQKFPSG